MSYLYSMLESAEFWKKTGVRRMGGSGGESGSPALNTVQLKQKFEGSKGVRVVQVGEKREGENHK